MEINCTELPRRTSRMVLAAHSRISLGSCIGSATLEASSWEMAWICLRMAHVCTISR